MAALKGVSTDKNNCSIKTLGDNLNVKFDKVLENTFYNIWLKDPATFVFNTTIEIQDSNSEAL